jgi:disulfide bond formation protein DsbB
VAVTTRTANLFFSLLALVALAGGVGLVIAGVTAAVSSNPRARLAEWLAGSWDRLLVVAFTIAAVATAGSLYYSQVAHFIPCELCWYQRICMYPLVIVLGVGALRRDDDVVWIALPIASLGLVISGYHVLIERYPSLEGNFECSLTQPCTSPYFREWGWMTIAGMAFCGFLAIVALSGAALIGAAAVRRLNDV